MSNATSLWARAEAVCEPVHRIGGGQGLAPKEKAFPNRKMESSQIILLLSCPVMITVSCVLPIKIVCPGFVAQFNGTEQIFLEWMLNSPFLCQVAM